MDKFHQIKHTFFFAFILLFDVVESLDWSREILWCMSITSRPRVKLQHPSKQITDQKKRSYAIGPYSVHTQKTWRLGQRHGLQNTTLTSYFSKKIYQKVIYVYFHKSIFQDKSIHIIFTFSNSTTWELFVIYILKVWLKPCPKRQVFRVWRE